MQISVYMLECCDGSFYTGLTRKEIEARVWEHEQGLYRGYTHRRRPVKLVFCEIYDRIEDAINRERQIKGWSRAKKKALIAGHYEKLPSLSENRQRGHPLPSTSSG